MPFFSIIVPIYQVEEYLKACVDSILKQRFRDFELILVDDGSKDACPVICDRYAEQDERIRVIHQANAGLSVARNAGFSLASGQYVLFIDADDMIASDLFLDKLFAKCQESHSDVVWFGYRKYYSPDRLGPEICRYPSRLAEWEQEKALQLLLETGMYNGAAWTKAVRRALLVRSGLVFRPDMLSEDLNWSLALMCHSRKMDALPESIVLYRQRPGSLSHRPPLKSLQDNLWILETWPVRLKESDLPLSHQRVLLSVLAHYWANMLILYSYYPSSVAATCKNRVRSLLYLRNYARDRRSRTLAALSRILGLRMTTGLLRLYCKIKTY